MQLSYLYDSGLISQVMPAMQRKLHTVVNLGVPQIVNVMGAIILRLSFLLAKQQDQTRDIPTSKTITVIEIEGPINEDVPIHGMFAFYSE